MNMRTVLSWGKISVFILGLFLASSLLAGCGGWGGDAGDATPNPAEGSNWDQMHWDQREMGIGWGEP